MWPLREAMRMIPAKFCRQSGHGLLSCQSIGHESGMSAGGERLVVSLSHTQKDNHKHDTHTSNISSRTQVKNIKYKHTDSYITHHTHA